MLLNRATPLKNVFNCGGFNKRFFTVSTCCCGRKTAETFDKRFTISPKDVSQHKTGGSAYLTKLLGMRDDMPRRPGYVSKTGRFIRVPEMIPEFIVPDLKDFKLKPYVSYRAEEVNQSEFTAKDLFSETIAQDLIRDFESKKITLEEILDKRTTEKKNV